MIVLYINFFNLCYKYLASASVRNLILDPVKINSKLKLDFEILSGSIDEFNLSMYILEKKLLATIDGIELNLLFPLNKLKMLIVSKPKRDNIDIKQLENSMINNNSNPIYLQLAEYSKLSLILKNIKINAYFEFEEKIYKFNLIINEISTNSHLESAIKQFVNIKDFDFSLTILKKENLESLNYKNNINNHLEKTLIKLNCLSSEKILQNFSINILLLAKNFRISDNNDNKSDNVEFNNCLDINIPTIEISLSQKTLINLSTFAIKFEDLKNQRNFKLSNGNYNKNIIKI